jgi:uncharacterized protein involved in exopolysaccharide biosynthesis/Mrp family chromosome partitioning ATPase
MNSTTPTPASASPGITVGDIYYVLFRHKWRIIGCAVAGLIAAGLIYRFKPPAFQSEAKLYIRYVTSEGKTSGPVVNDQTKSPDQRGETIMQSEQQILTSFDLAKQVAEAVGPAKIMAKSGGGKDLNQAAAVVHRGLSVTVPWATSVIDIVFVHSDPEIVQPILQEVLDRYRKKHIEIHQSAGVLNDSLTQETDNLRSQLAQTEEDLRKAINKAGVVSLADAKKNQAEKIDRIQEQIQTAEADYAERLALFEAVTKQSGETPPAADAPAPSEPTPAQIDAYKVASARVALLRKTEQELLTSFKDTNSRVQDIRAQLSEAEDTKSKLEQETPALVRSQAASPTPSRTVAADFDPVLASAQLAALQAKIKTLHTQLDGVRAEVAALNQTEGQITELQRRRDQQDTYYRYYAARQDQSRIDDALGNNGRVSGITVIQEATPPWADPSKTLKLVQMIAAAGLGLGLGWAFFIEFYLDRTVRRPSDVERLLKFPLFLSIPILGGNARQRLKASKKGAASKEQSPAELVPWDDSHELRPFHETLRDRLIGYFESRNLTHKPKLLAVTGLGRNTGVTTTAAGLASSLSETGEGNVLLVDMTPGHGSAQQFYQGKPVAGFEELFDVRETAQVQDKLYVVAEGSNGEKLSGVLPQRFSKLVPKLKASNFDYIIFDMPPVSQISVTPRLAGFMDMVLLVIESEKTDRDLVQRAANLLAQSKANVGAVLNKTRHYVPRRLHQDREFLLGS